MELINFLAGVRKLPGKIAGYGIQLPSHSPKALREQGQ